MSSSDVSTSLRQRVREAARDRCGYCLSPQRYVMGKLEIEHIIPRVRGGSDDESNLWLSCSLCNRYKGSQTTGVDPLDGAPVEFSAHALQFGVSIFVGVRMGTHMLIRTLMLEVIRKPSGSANYVQQ